MIAVILILTALEMPNLWRARAAANQAAAAASLRAIETAEAAYAATYGGGYSAGLSQLGPPAAGAVANSGAAGLLDEVLASGEKGGYQYVYIPGPVTNGKITSYSVEAVPTMPCVTGSLTYTVDSSSGGAVSSQPFQVSTQSDPVTQVLGNSMGGASCSGQ